MNSVAASLTGSTSSIKVSSGRNNLTLPAWLEVNVGGRNGHLYMPPIPEVPLYDEDGNLKSDSRWQYVWDAENRLVQMTTQPAALAAGVPGLRLSFAYDYQSRRISKRIEKLNPSLSTWELTRDLRFVYDGWNVMAEIQMKGEAEDAPNAGITLGTGLVRLPYPVRSYVWGPDMSGTEGGAGGVGGLLAMTRHSRQGKAAENYWATWDLNGNVIGLVSTTKEGRMALYDYDAFGQTTRVNEPEVALNPVRFSSKYTDEETGLVYYGYRYYSPEVGRWISRDPIEEKGGVNLYGMVGNDAVNAIDPFGLYTKKIDGKGIVTLSIEQCEIVILDGHGHKITPHTFEFPDSSKGCSARGGFVGCSPGTANLPIPEENRVPGVSYDSDSRLDTEGLMIS